jgi:formiminoglutamate deiminase
VSARYWCELAWLGGEAADAGVLVDVDGERIASVRPGVTEPPPGATRLDGLTLPGLSNAHSHAFHRALRGRTHAQRGSFWTWRASMYGLARRLDPDRYHELARATFAEMALAGVTAVGEFHYLHHDFDGRPYADPNATGHAVIDAARAAGIRITLLDTCYLRGGFDAELDPVQRRFADPDAEAWADRVDSLRAGDGASVGAAIHSVRAVDPDSARIVAAWADERTAPLHAHVSEQPAENEVCVSVYGGTPTALLADAGAVTDRFTAVHATHVADSDIGLLGNTGASCCLCPTTERDLADGIGPARRLADAGSRLALGTDSHAIIDPFEEARALELDERLASGERGRHSPPELLRAATAGGHLSLGWPDAGRIAQGMRADLVTVGLDHVRLAGTDARDVLGSVVFSATAADVRHVLADGCVVVCDGRHVSLDVAAELRSAIRALEPA